MTHPPRTDPALAQWRARVARLEVERVRLTADNDRLRTALTLAQTALLTVRDPFWVPPNVLEAIDAGLAAIEAVLEPGQQEET